jgi:hypothetical protein
VTVTTGIDDGNLEKLQAATDGTYVRLNPRENLKVEWATKLTGSKKLTHEKHIFQYPLALALVLLFALFLRGAVVSSLGSRRMKARPSRTSVH